MSPADAIEGFFQELVGQATPDAVVVRNTYIHADRFPIEKIQPLPAHVEKNSKVAQEKLEAWL
eukprot:99803-Prymnesium_polylepis.1